MAKSRNEEDRMEAASNPHTPSKVLDKLARGWNNHVCEKVASNPHTSASTLSNLTQHNSWYVRQSAASNLFTPADALNSMMEEEDGWDEGFGWDEAEERVSQIKTSSNSTIVARSEVAEFKKSLGQQNHRGRSLAQLQADFVRNMDGTKYDSPEAFESAQERVKKLSPAEFGMLMKAVVEEDEGI